MSKTTKIVIAVLAVLVLAGGYGVYWFLKDDAPAEVNLADAVGSVTDDTESTATTAATDETTDDTSDSGSAAADGIEGTWTAQSDPAGFDVNAGEGTFVGFRIAEELSGIGQTTAVGRTPDVTGEITIEGTTLTEATFEADMTTIVSNDSRRNGRIQSALETGDFPTATFTLTDPVDLGDAAESGDPVTVTASGELTIHGVTTPVEIELQAQLTGGTIVVVGSLDPLVFSDYGVEVPRSGIVVSVADEGIVEVQLLLTRS